MLNMNQSKKLRFTAYGLIVFSVFFLSAQLCEATNSSIESRESKTLDLLSRIDAFSDRDPVLAEDSGKAHYNMGNIYFQKGEYEIAAREYYQASILMPNDPDTHYNLAYVSSEFLKDYETSLKHFKLYLYFSPRAKDKKYIKEQIVHAELQLRARIDSKLEK